VVLRLDTGRAPPAPQTPLQLVPGSPLVATFAKAEEHGVVTQSEAQSQAMLQVCSGYAAEHGFAFALEKCEIVCEDRLVIMTLPASPGPRPPDAAGWALAPLIWAERFTYLCAVSSNWGFDTLNHARARAKTAHSDALSLVRIGCNGGGYGARLERQLFFQVVQPALL
jgi:hypothetical protein